MHEDIEMMNGAGRHWHFAQDVKERLGLGIFADSQGQIAPQARCTPRGVELRVLRSSGDGYVEVWLSWEEVRLLSRQQLPAEMPHDETDEYVVWAYPPAPADDASPPAVQMQVHSPRRYGGGCDTTCLITTKMAYAWLREAEECNWWHRTAAPPAQLKEGELSGGGPGAAKPGYFFEEEEVRNAATLTDVKNAVLAHHSQPNLESSGIVRLVLSSFLHGAFARKFPASLLAEQLSAVPRVLPILQQLYVPPGPEEDYVAVVLAHLRDELKGMEALNAPESLVTSLYSYLEQEPPSVDAAPAAPATPPEPEPAPEAREPWTRQRLLGQLEYDFECSVPADMEARSLVRQGITAQEALDVRVYPRAWSQEMRDYVTETLATVKELLAGDIEG